MRRRHAAQRIGDSQRAAHGFSQRSSDLELCRMVLHSLVSMNWTGSRRANGVPCSATWFVMRRAGALRDIAETKSCGADRVWRAGRRGNPRPLLVFLATQVWPTFIKNGGARVIVITQPRTPIRAAGRCEVCGNRWTP